MSVTFDGWPDRKQWGTGCDGSRGFTGIQPGVFNHGANTDGSGRCAEVLTDSDGNKMFRMPRGSGQNNNAGGIKFSFTPLSDLSFSYRKRWSQGFAWSGGNPNYTKDLYFIAGANLIIQGYQGGAEGYNVGGSQNIPSTATWSHNMGGSLGDGRWHQFDGRINQPARTLELWIDGVKVLERTNVNFPGQAIDHFAVSNQNSVSGTHHTDFDDLLICTGRPVGARGCQP
jgi:hypothetical protein